MEFQFGTNWARYAHYVGVIFGSPLAVEGIYAFFLEAGFLALLLFGWNRIGPRLHLFSTWSRWAPTSAPSGSWWRTRGCKHPPVIISPGK
jgi:cytochrome d ubiquinol oxidase subunit I